MSLDVIQAQHITSLIDDLRMRDAWAVVSAFLQSQSIPFKDRKSWLAIQHTLNCIRKDEGEWGALSPALEQFVSNIYLFGTKRVFLLTDRTIDPMSFAENDPSKASVLGFFDNEVFNRPANHVGYHLKQWSHQGMDIYSFVTTRRIYVNQQISADSLNVSSQIEFSNAVVTARTPKHIRAYDHLIRNKDFTCLLLDQPGNMDKALVSADAFRYETLCQSQAADKKLRPFIDLFPILSLLYLDPSDGIVNYMDSLANESAAVRGKYNHNSVKDLRRHPILDEARKKGLQVDPFVLGLKWRVSSEHPTILLSGDKDMAESAMGSSLQRRCLEYMTLPGHMSAHGFLHVINRINHHLNDALLAASTSVSTKAEGPNSVNTLADNLRSV